MKTLKTSLSILSTIVAVLTCHANTYTVTTTNDTGPGSLRAVISTANGLPGPHVINFANSGHFAGGGRIVLLSPMAQIAQSVAIAGWRSIGATNNAITITGSPLVFAAGTSNSLEQLNISGQITNGQSISISGCAITNGGIQSTGVLQIIASSVISSPTAGIWSSGNATLNEVTVSLCSEGGIHNEGTMAIANCVISNNTHATDGGGIYSKNSLHVTRCQIVGNGTLNGRGGGVFNEGTASFSDTTIRSNIAYSGLGGGICNMGQQLSLLACLVANNVAQGQNGNGGGGGGAGVGGGLYSLSFAVIATNVTFSGNQALGGAGAGGAAGTGGGPNPGTGGTPGAPAGTCGPAGGSGGRGSDGGKFSGGGGGGNGGAGHDAVLTSGCYRVCHEDTSDGSHMVLIWYCGRHGSLNNRLGRSSWPLPTSASCATILGSSITTCPSYATCGAQPSGSAGAGGNGGYGGGGGYANGSGGMFGGNAASTGGGGAGMGSAIYVATGSLALVSCTVVNNQANGGAPGGLGVAAMFTEFGQISLLNSLIASNSSSNGTAPDVYGAVSSQGHNFIGNNIGSTGWDPVWDYQNAVPLLLGPLQDNGGPTFTHALLPGSFCILAGTSVGAPATDQRSVIRPLSQCDIGAYQYTTLVPTVIAWTNPGPIVYSTPLSAVQLNAKANAGGAFTYSPPPGTVLNAGSNQILTAIFTPSDPTSYTAATNTVFITVMKANQVISFPTIPPQTINAPPILLSASASSGLPVVYTLISGPALLAGNLLSVGSSPGQVVVRAEQAGNSNYIAAPNVDQSFLVVSGSKPSITSQPINQTVDIGANATFSVAATTSPLTYQWQFQSLTIPGETNQSLSLLRVKAGQEGPYRVIVSNPIGSVTSVTAVLTVNVPAGVPNISAQPGNHIIRVGETAVLSVGATGDAVLKFQWYRGQTGNTNGLIGGATNASYTVSGLVDTASFWVSVRNTLGMIDSASATVTVVPAIMPRLGLSRISGMAAISVDGLTGTQYLLQYSTNVTTTNWNTLLDYNQNVNPFIYIDSGALGVPTRFYRAMAH